MSPYGPVWARQGALLRGGARPKSLRRGETLRKNTHAFYMNVYFKRGCTLFQLFPLFKVPGRAHTGPYGPFWAHMDPKNPQKYVKKSLY